MGTTTRNHRVTRLRTRSVTRDLPRDAVDVNNGPQVLLRLTRNSRDASKGTVLNLFGNVRSRAKGISNNTSVSNFRL